MVKKIVLGAVALVLAAALIWALIPPREVPTVLESLDTDALSVEDWADAIAYVPLDDRTDNLEDVVYLAEASGFRICLPEGDTYCTKLDGQALNSNGTQYGDRGALMAWVREMDERGCDLFLLSMDQLLSGGLANSRSLSGETDIVFPDGTVLDETDAFDEYILSLAEDPSNQIYLFDSVVRLASTVAYGGFGLEEYEALRAYGMVARPSLEGDALTMENVFAQYPYARDGSTLAQDEMAESPYRPTLTEEMISDYLAVRRRKLRLTDHAIGALKTARYDNIHLLIGIDDSSNTENIQYNELRYLESRLGRGSTLLTGLDSLARLLVAQIGRERYDYHVKTSVTYVGGGQSKPSSEFDRYTLEEVVDLHMDLFQAERVEEDEAELRILVMTAPDDPDRAGDYCEELISALERAREEKAPTVLIEASNNAYGDMLEQMLFERVDFPFLIAFAGKYDQANVTGAAFAMGFSRYLYLRCCPEKDPACDVFQVRQTTNSLALTYPYILHTRASLNAFVQRLRGNYNNIHPNNVRDKLIRWRLERLLLPGCEKVCQAMEGGTVLTSLEPYGEARVGDVSIRDAYLPWNRTFEVSFTIDVAPLDPVG